MKQKESVLRHLHDQADKHTAEEPLPCTRTCHAFLCTTATALSSESIRVLPGELPTAFRFLTLPSATAGTVLLRTEPTADLLSSSSSSSLRTMHSGTGCGAVTAETCESGCAGDSYKTSASVCRTGSGVMAALSVSSSFSDGAALSVCSTDLASTEVAARTGTWARRGSMLRSRQISSC